MTTRPVMTSHVLVRFPSVLIDVHAHFLHDRTPRADWRERNASRLRAGERVGITIHVASILGSWGHTSPIYFPSRDDLVYGNDRMLALQREHPARIRGYVTVNPNYTEHALAEIRRCLDGGHDRDQAGGEPPRRRSAARSDLRARARSGACRSCITSGSTAGATIRARRRPTPSSWAGSRGGTRA